MEKRSDQDLAAFSRSISRSQGVDSPYITPITERSPTVSGVNPFDTPFHSELNSRAGSTHPSSLDLSRRGGGTTYFRSRRIQKGKVEKPWLSNIDPREKWTTIIPVFGILVGLAISGFLIYDGLHSVVNHTYCIVLDEDFSSGLNPQVWTKEAEVGGFGNGQFEETTVTDENVFVESNVLTIKPTLQNAKLVEQNNILNLTKEGICTSPNLSNCVAFTNTTNGTIVNPVKSGRINTKKGASIKYGRVEVTAKLPVGDWLWPAIWMMPVQDTYGAWPRSGEIDIAESRGNNHTYAQGGNNIVSSALHWGPDAANDAWWRTNVKRNSGHTTFAAQYRTFGVEWSEKYIFTYIDTRLLQVLYTNFAESLWERGQFPLSSSNGTQLIDPWSQTGRPSTPFDQNFYLILNVAVGGTNGWFEDGKSGKPWVDQSPTAKKDFWTAQDQWYPTWKQQGWMEISQVRMWQQKGYNGC